jgi:hypothetical protein
MISIVVPGQSQLFDCGRPFYFVILQGESAAKSTYNFLSPMKKDKTAAGRILRWAMRQSNMPLRWSGSTAFIPKRSGW